MKDKFFLDTNIWVYAFEKGNQFKHETSKDLIKLAHKGNGCISFQVIQEFLNVSTKKFAEPLKPEDAKKFLSKLLFPICETFPSEELYGSALDISSRWQLSFYDSLIVAGALECNCKILYSEDMHHGTKIYELQIVNPFV